MEQRGGIFFAVQTYAVEVYRWKILAVGDNTNSGLVAVGENTNSGLVTVGEETYSGLAVGENTNSGLVVGEETNSGLIVVGVLTYNYLFFPVATL